MAKAPKAEVQKVEEAATPVAPQAPKEPEAKPVSKPANTVKPKMVITDF